MMNTTQPVISGEIYHVFNRAVGNERLFKNDNDYRQWISKFKSFILPHADVVAYCLLPNHYHFLLKVSDSTDSESFSKAMSDSANAYAKWFNLVYKRKGSLFMRPYKRLQIDSTEYLCWCLWYIHHNPAHHNYTKDWMNWTYSSYKAYISNHPTVINKTILIELFGGLEEFINYHKMQSGETKFEIFLET